MRPDRIPPVRDLSLDQLFATQYEWLMRWAEHFTRGHQEQPEDLVHDLFIQVLRTAPRFDSEDAAKAYLYRALRNQFVGSVTRRTRSQHQQLSLYEYDSVEFAIAGVDRASLLWIREDLWIICRYVCQRKSVLRAASFFILRFFLDHSPSEIMELAGASRASLDKNIQLMREEVRGYLSGSGSVVVMPGRHLHEPPPAPVGTVRDLFQQFSAYIASCSQGDCLSKGDIDEIYSSSQMVSTEIVAHLVSCPVCRERCLDVAQGNSSGMRGGPSIVSKRKPARRNGPASTFDGGAFQRRMRRNFEHRPQYLYLTVDGTTEASQKVASPTSELGATVIARQSSFYAEVTSEQGVRLLSLLIEDDYLRSPTEMVVEAELSDGRSIRMEAFPCGHSMAVRVLYKDPVIEQIRGLEPGLVAKPGIQPLMEAAAPPPDTPRTLPARLRALFGGVYWPTFALGGAIPLLLIVMVCPDLVAHYRRSRAMAELARTQASQKALQREHDLRQVGFLEVREPGQAIHKEKIEIWRSSATDKTAVRLYNLNGKLQKRYLALDPKTTTSLAADAVSSGRADDVWRAGFDPEIAAAMLRRGDTGSVSRKGSSERITVRAAENASHARLVEAVLVVDLPARRVREQDYVVRNAAGLEHVRLVETQETLLERGQIPSSVFTRNPEKSEPGRASKGASASLSPHHSGVSLSSQEIDALWAVQAVNPRPEETIAVQRIHNAVRITGVVATRARRTAFIRGIQAACPHCRIDIAIPASARQFRRGLARMRNVTVQEANIANSPSPAEDLLWHAPRMPSIPPAARRAQTTQIAEKLFAQSSAVVRDSHFLKMIASCCGEAEMQKLPEAQQKRWMEMMDRRLDHLSTSLASVDSGIDAVSEKADLPYSVSSAPAGSEPIPSLDQRGLQQIEQLHSTAVGFRLSLQRFFSSSEGPNDNPQEMWRQLCLRARRLNAQVKAARQLIPTSR